jgi:hypothetical protein
MGAAGGQLMVAAALADSLTDFGNTERRRSRPTGGNAVESRLGLSGDTRDAGSGSPEPMDVEALLAGERRKTEADVTARLEERFRETLALERQAHAREKEEMLASAGREAAERMLARLDEMEERLLALTGAATARILSSIVSDDVRERSVGELARTIRQAAGDDETIRIRVKAPQALFAALAENLGGWAVHLEHVDSAETDITVDINDTVFETRLGEWSASLMEALS